MCFPNINRSHVKSDLRYGYYIFPPEDVFLWHKPGQAMVRALLHFTHLLVVDFFLHCLHLCFWQERPWFACCILSVLHISVPELAATQRRRTEGWLVRRPISFFWPGRLRQKPHSRSFFDYRVRKFTKLQRSGEMTQKSKNKLKLQKTIHNPSIYNGKTSRAKRRSMGGPYPNYSTRG
jgi:hypothetical protein